MVLMYLGMNKVSKATQEQCSCSYQKILFIFRKVAEKLDADFFSSKYFLLSILLLSLLQLQCSCVAFHRRQHVAHSRRALQKRGSDTSTSKRGTQRTVLPQQKRKHCVTLRRRFWQRTNSKFIVKKEFKNYYCNK